MDDTVGTITIPEMKDTIIDKLTQVYRDRESYIKYGDPISPRLAEEIERLEKEYLNLCLRPQLESLLPHCIDVEPITDTVTIAAEYTKGALCRIGLQVGGDVISGMTLTHECEYAEESPSVDEIETSLENDNAPEDCVTENTPEYQEDLDGEEKENDEVTENTPWHLFSDDLDHTSTFEENSDSSAQSNTVKDCRLRVTFDDGTVICHTTSKRTMIETISRLGFESASHYRGKTYNGYAYVGRTQIPKLRTPDKQKEVDGWWIFTNLTNWQKKEYLEGLAKFLNKRLKIELILKNSSADPHADKKNGIISSVTIKSKENTHSNPRAVFSLNGGEPKYQNAAVLETVRQFLEEFPNSSFEELSAMFPKHLQGSYGVIRTLKDIEERSRNNKTEYTRWFLDPADILISGDNIKFAVCSQWGPSFQDFRKHILKEFDWEIIEVNK